MARPKGVTTRDSSVRITRKLSSLSWVVAISSKADFGSSCLRSEEGYEEDDGILVVALWSGLAFAAVARSWDSLQLLLWRVVSASAIVWAWLAVGMRCGTTTMLR